MTTFLVSFFQDDTGAVADKALTNKQMTILPARISEQAYPLIDSVSRCYLPPVCACARHPFYMTTCEEVGINLDSTVLQSSFTPSDFGDGGEIW